MASLGSIKKPSYRYANAASSADSLKSSNPSSSTDSTHQPHSHNSSSRSLTRPHAPSTAGTNLGSLVKKLVEHRSKPKGEMKLVVPKDLSAKRGNGLSGLHKKLFKGVKRDEESEKKKKDLSEAKGNTRTLAMLLRSERELLSMNKEQENQINELKLMLEKKNIELWCLEVRRELLSMNKEQENQINELKLMLEDKNIEAEELKDLCLKQREEIKSLKNDASFPDVMYSQLQELVERQGLELEQANQLIPSLEKQVASLMGQLECLAQELAEVKAADKYSVRGCYDSLDSSPRSPEAANSLEFSYENTTPPGSPDDMLLKDLNPCLTPYSAKTKSKEFEFNRYSKAIREARGSDESKYTYRKQIESMF